MVKEASIRDLIAFWIFGLANNFAYVVMLSAANDIIHAHGDGSQGHTGNSSANTSQTCIENLGRPHCQQLMSTGAILLADIIPSVFVKITFPFFMDHFPYGLRIASVIVIQALSYWIVADAPSIFISLIGVGMASFSSGLGESCFLGLASHYSKGSITTWSSGTGGAGIFGALVYAGLTEPHFLALSPRTALLCMLVIPVCFAIAYWMILTPAPTVHRAQFLKPTSWLVPQQRSPSVETMIAAPTANENSSSDYPRISSGQQTDEIPQNLHLRYGATSNTTIRRRSAGDSNSVFESSNIQAPSNNTTTIPDPPLNDELGTSHQHLTPRNKKPHQQQQRGPQPSVSSNQASSSGSSSFSSLQLQPQPSFIAKIRLITPLLKYMVPLTIVYISEYVINSGLHQLMVYDCAHGLHLTPDSQFRWYQALYQLGVFASRTSVGCVELPLWVLYLLPFLQVSNVAAFYSDALWPHNVLPNIWVAFALVLVEGVFGGASYANTFNRIHRKARPEVREFSLSITSVADSLGVAVAGFLAIAIYNHVCSVYANNF